MSTNRDVGRLRVGRLAGCLAIALGMSASAAFAGLRPSADHLASRDRVVATQTTASRKSESGPVIHQVQSCDDTGLRQAITSALDGDTVAMPMGCGLITLTAGAIPIMVDNLSLVGPGADAFTIDGGYSTGYYDRVLRHYGSGVLSISGMTIADAKLLDSAEPNGGCIDSDGTVTLVQSTVTTCYLQGASGLNARGGAVYGKLSVKLYSSIVTSSEAHASAGSVLGGGIFSNGYLYLSDSTVSDNSAAEPGFGGGIYAIHGDVVIRASTISGNRAFTGGGILAGYIGGPTALAEITDSTISGNYASGYIGGVDSHIPAMISNSTVAFNTALNTALGIGVYAKTTLVATSSIFSSNFTPAGDLGMDVYALTGIIDGEKNIIVLTPSTPPQDTITACPRLGPLADNGGPTRTHALFTGSPAIDAGENPLALQFDQRLDGYVRSFGAAADIGAYEWQGDLQDGIFSSGFEFACN